MQTISVYDEVSFPSYPHAASHPERLATIAAFRGLVTPDVENCRVLELGCGVGGNLLPMAATLPNSHFVGVDQSASQIDAANQQAANCNLANARFLAQDLAEFDVGGGPFDYIIAHGIFSWTTPAGRESILAICRNCLSSTGVAYINFNTYPGWYVQNMLKDMLLLHADRFIEPADRVREARRMIEFLLATSDAQSPQSSVLRSELESLRRQSDAYIFHAYLNVRNEPFYLREVIRQAQEQELQYLGDAEPDAMWPAAVAPQIDGNIRELLKSTAANSTDLNADVEQYYDLVRFTNSRRSLFCRADRPLQAQPSFDAFSRLYFSANLRTPTPPPGVPAGHAFFVNEQGRSITLAEPRLVATLTSLCEIWPESRPWSWLVAEVDRRLTEGGASAASSFERWQADLWRCFAAGIVQLSIHPTLCTRETSQPAATALARQQAATQEFVANLRHGVVRLNELERQILQQLDESVPVEERLAEVARITGSTAAAHQILQRLASLGLIRRSE